MQKLRGHIFSLQNNVREVNPPPLLKIFLKTYFTKTNVLKRSYHVVEHLELSFLCTVSEDLPI